MKLLFDSPLKGESKYGQYFAYAVECNGEEMTFFSPSDDVNEKLINLKRGSKVQITKTAKQNGKGIKVDYEVLVLEEKKAEQNGNGSTHDNYYELMLHSYEDALKINEKLGGLVDVSRIGITLFIARSKINGNGFGAVTNG
ncbi:MAG: hypothetical protein NTX65_12535 [Ignavibacteriales bacterium]|nr:hypothetical protein [Ignavibacteriales bacterium]